eukprot:64210-Prymnesium_polylepis.1
MTSPPLTKARAESPRADTSAHDGAVAEQVAPLVRVLRARERQVARRDEDGEPDAARDSFPRLPHGVRPYDDRGGGVVAAARRAKSMTHAGRRRRMRPKKVKARH